MSRWVEQFQAHAFQNFWENILNISADLYVDDSTVATSVEELARLRKVLTFLDGLIKSCDPELIPMSTWDNFQGQCVATINQINNYQNNRNIAHIQTANEHLDNLLTYLRPYQVTINDSDRAIHNSFKEYSLVVNKSLHSFQKKANTIISEIGENKTKSSDIIFDLEMTNSNINDLSLSYFDDADEASLSTRIKELEIEIKRIFKEINDYKIVVLDGNDETKAIKNKIENALIISEESSSSIDKMLNDATPKLTEISKYYVDVFGNKNLESEHIGGLKNEVLERSKQLDDFKKQQEIKYNELNKEIESLLPPNSSPKCDTFYFKPPSIVL